MIGCGPKFSFISFVFLVEDPILSRNLLNRRLKADNSLKDKFLESLSVELPKDLKRFLAPILTTPEASSQESLLHLLLNVEAIQLGVANILLELLPSYTYEE